MKLPGKEVWYDWNGANEWLFKLINGISGDIYDKTMILLSSIADHHHFPYYIGGLAVFALLTYIVRKMGGRGGASNMLAAWLAIFVVLASGYAAEGYAIHRAKDYFSYPRPYIALGSEVRVLELRDANDNYHSFPSGHVAFITMMVVGLWPVLSKNMKWLGAVLIFGVCWSRMALGVHFPADVLASVLFVFPMMVILRFLIYRILRQFTGLKC